MLKEKIKLVWYHTVRLILLTFCKIIFRYRIFGKENIPKEGAIILTCNHQSFLDPVLCGAPISRRLCYMARDSLFHNFIFGWMIRSVNTIPLKRGKGDITTIREVIARLKQGHGVCLFPEGTRSADGKIANLKPGFGLLCRKSNAPIIPVVIDGAFECWPRHKKMFTIGGKITVKFGQIITTEQVNEYSNQEFADTFTKKLRQMQNQCRLEQGKEPYKY